MIIAKPSVVFLVFFFLLQYQPVRSQTHNCRTVQEIPPTTPTNEFLNNLDGTITDLTTGLTWAICIAGKSSNDCSAGTALTTNWEDALEYANELSMGGFNDWRVPNIKELATIVELRCVNPALNLELFPNSPNGQYWTSSPRTTTNEIWSIHFRTGAIDTGTSISRFLRVVRGGQID